MIKQTFSIGAALIALGVIFGGTPVFADEPVVTSDEPAEEDKCMEGTDMKCDATASDDEIGEPDDLNAVTDCVEGAEDTDCMEVITTAPVPTESEECEGEDCEEAEEEEEGEPAAWPMYVSLAALGAAVVVFIVLNLLGGKKK